jgi:hypothetical protein
MAMTKKTTTTWTTAPTGEEFVAARTAFMQSALDAGKTDSLTATVVSENVGTRNWLNDAAANEWVSFLNTQAASTQTTTLSDI